MSEKTQRDHHQILDLLLETKLQTQQNSSQVEYI